MYLLWWCLWVRVGYLVAAYAPWQFKGQCKMQFTSIPSWFSIGQSVAELHIVWWTLHATQVNDFTAFNLVAHALLLIATTSSSTTSAMLVINCRAGVPKLTRGGEKPRSSSAFSFRVTVCEWEPDNRKSTWAKGGLEERGWLQWMDQEPLCSTKWDLQTLQSTFPKDCQSARSEGRLGGKKHRSITRRVAFSAAFLSSQR